MAHPGLLAAACGALALLLAGCGGTTGPTALSGRACLARLDAHNVAYRPTEIGNASDARCHIDTAVRVSRVATALNHPATMSCAMADRLDAFETEVVQPLANAELGRHATRIDHLGSYSCRLRNSRESGRLSQHALGQAIDIAGSACPTAARSASSAIGPRPGRSGSSCVTSRSRRAAISRSC